MPAVSDTESQELADLFRAFRRASFRLRGVFQGPPDGLALAYKLSAEVGGPTTSAFTGGDRIHRHAALLRPFMEPTSIIELRSLWSRICASALADETVQRSIEDAFERADRLPMALKVGDRQMTARDIYHAYAEGTYFAEDPAAKSMLEAMSVGPMAPFVEMLFHEACGSYAALVFELLPVVLGAERAFRGTSSSADDVPATCIYCRTTGGDFGPEEHVIPESLIGDGMVIKGSVCRACNNRLSTLDQALIEFDPLALLRAMYLPLTKRGRFPRATVGDTTVEKIAPRHLRMTTKGNRPPPVFEHQPDGTVRFQESFEIRHSDPIRLARAVYKIGLGLVAHDIGAEGALDPRYDAARAFILDGTPIASHLLMPTSGTPSPQVRTWWRPFDENTAVVLDLYGLVFAFGLEPGPAELPPDAPADAFITFWLGESEDPLTG